jgi:P-type Ca2+ transporter type 2C
MWKMIIGQSIFQLVVILVLYFAGDSILGYDTSIPEQKLQLDTILFNVFVWMQIFNELNCRRLDNKFNVFEGVHRNLFFLIINAIMIGLQVGIIFVGSQVFKISPEGLNGVQWAISIIIAAFTLPWGVLVRVFPDVWFERCVEFVTLPFVASYRCMGRVFGSAARLMPRRGSKKSDAAGSQASNDDVTHEGKKEKPGTTITIAPPKENV